MSTASLYCDNMITPNQHNELTLFLGCEELSRKISLVDMSDFDMNNVLIRPFCITILYHNLLLFIDIFHI
jgi:hypothetical protein